jgi:peptidoglycan/LPS O-acetylase OafA/YrhL
MLNALLSSRPLVWIGKRSYGVYLWHWPIFRAVSTITYHGAAEQVGLIVAEFAITFVVVALSYKFLERPALRLKERFRPVPLTAAVPMGL